MERHSLIGKLIGLPAYSPMLDALSDPALLFIDHFMTGPASAFNHGCCVGTSFSPLVSLMIVQHGCHPGALIHVRGSRLVHIRYQVILLRLLTA